MMPAQPVAKAMAVICAVVTASCSGQAIGPTAGGASAVFSSSAASPSACQARDLGSRFVGGGVGTGNDFGSIIIWNLSGRPCLLAGRVTFTAYYSSGARDVNAHPNRTPPPVSFVLPAGMRPFRDGEDATGYLTADLMGPERDDPTQPNGLCRRQDQLSPTTLVLTIGAVTLRLDNRDANARQTKAIYGCHGLVLLEDLVKPGG